MPRKNHWEIEHLTPLKTNELFHDGTIMNIIIMNPYIKGLTILLILSHAVICSIMLSANNHFMRAHATLSIFFSAFAILGIYKGKYLFLYVY